MCVTGAWIWSEGPGIYAHYVNCIPMTGQGRNIFNLAGNPNAIEGQDYEFYCPISLDDEGKVNKNQPDYFVVMKRCQLPLREECRSTQTLEQALSPLTTGSHCLKITQNVAFEYWNFPPIFVQLNLTCLVTLFDCKLQVFKNLQKWTILALKM